MQAVYAGIEAGGTKMVLAVSDKEMNLVERISIPTTTPEETIPKMIDFFSKYEVLSLGIGCFGPLDLNEKSNTYGYITTTPKANWKNTDMLTPFRDALGVEPMIDTDVNGAILGEVMHGNAKGCDSALYITIGTGIGVGVYINGSLLHGLMHPEAGHMLINRLPGDNFQGTCGCHRDCVEGLASGPAIEKRWGEKAQNLIDKAEVWEMESEYIAQAITNYILCYSPEKIVLWGGVMHVDGLMDKIRQKTHEKLGGYISLLSDYKSVENLIVEPGLGENPGIIGAIELGKSKINLK